MGSAKPASYQEGTQPMASLSCHVQIGLCIFLDGNGSRRQAARSKATAAKALYISQRVRYFYQIQFEAWVGFGPAGQIRVHEFCTFKYVLNMFHKLTIF